MIIYSQDQFSHCHWISLSSWLQLYYMVCQHIMSIMPAVPPTVYHPMQLKPNISIHASSGYHFSIIYSISVIQCTTYAAQTISTLALSCRFWLPLAFCRFWLPLASFQIVATAAIVQWTLTFSQTPLASSFIFWSPVASSCRFLSLLVSSCWLLFP